MTRKDIEVIHRDRDVIIQSDNNFFSFAKNSSGTIEAFCTTDLTPEMNTDIILSGIVDIKSCVNGSLILSPKFGYNILKMQEVIIAIFEKFDL